MQWRAGGGGACYLAARAAARHCLLHCLLHSKPGWLHSRPAQRCCVPLCPLNRLPWSRLVYRFEGALLPPRPSKYACMQQAPYSSFFVCTAFFLYQKSVWAVCLGCPGLWPSFLLHRPAPNKTTS